MLSGNNAPVTSIGFFNSNKAWGGGEKWHFSTAHMMKERNMEVTVFAQPDCELIRRTRNAGISSVACRVSNISFLNPVKVIRLTRIFRKLHLQALILNLPSDVKIAGIAARLAGIKKIIYRRGSPVPVKNSLMNRFLFRYVLTDIIANSNLIKKNILLNNPLLVRNSKIRIIHNGITGSPVSASGHSSRPAPGSEAVVIGAAGRLSPEKGMEWLIRLAHCLKKNGNHFVLQIAGDGPLKERLMKKSQELGLTDCVVFKGFITEMDLFYSTIDLFVLTSAWEGCSNVILEAMANGLPVIAFNNSSIPEMIKDNINGFLVKNEDINELTGKVELLLGDPLLRIKLGQSGKKLAIEKYDNNRCFDQLMDLVTD